MLAPQGADQGHKDAQCCMGCSFRDGEGVPVDGATAAHCFRKAADEGHVFALEALSAS